MVASLPFSKSDFYFELPDNLIAQHPCSPRDASRLLVIDRMKGSISEHPFRDFPSFLTAQDHLVFNDTKVLPARLQGHKETGASVELFCLRALHEKTWEVLLKPGKKCPPGTRIFFADGSYAKVEENLEDGLKSVSFSTQESVINFLQQHGQVPLPHYIKRDETQTDDQHQYQTIFAQIPGAVAAPTAGLHFTKDILDALSSNQVATHSVTLHVGLGTFRPLKEENILQHKMHSEFYDVPEGTFNALSSLSDASRVLAVGTTSCRALETVFNPSQSNSKLQGQTDLFIYPGYAFNRVDALLTNFHLPESTLLMLVCAFGGYDLIMEAYHYAVANKFRFFSYGDAMLIL